MKFVQICLVMTIDTSLKLETLTRKKGTVLRLAYIEREYE